MDTSAPPTNLPPTTLHPATRPGACTAGRIDRVLAPESAIARRVAAALGAAPTRVTLLCDPDGTVLWVSASAAPLVGLDPATLVGTRLAPEPAGGQPALVLGADGRPRRIDVHRTDLTHDPEVRGVLVEWTVRTEPPAPHDCDGVTGLLDAAGLGRAVLALGDVGGETSVAVLRLRADRALPDDAMREVGERLRHALRKGDVAGRLDDGDVVVVSPGHWTPASAASLAQRLRSHVNGPVLSAEGRAVVRLTAGVATGPTPAFPVLLRHAGDDLGPARAGGQRAGSSASG